MIYVIRQICFFVDGQDAIVIDKDIIAADSDEKRAKASPAEPRWEISREKHSRIHIQIDRIYLVKECKRWFLGQGSGKGLGLSLESQGCGGSEGTEGLGSRLHVVGSQRQEGGAWG